MRFRNAFLLVLALEALVAVLGVANYGWTIEGLQAVTRFSGRLSLFLFSIIFLFHRHRLSSLKALMSENYFLVFAIAHGIHLAELLTYVIRSGAPIIPYRLLGGFIAYLLIFLLPLAQARHNAGALTEKRFNQFSLVYLYYVWFIFFMTYLTRVRGQLPAAGGSYWEWVILLGWTSLLLGIKLSQLFSRQSVKLKS